MRSTRTRARVFTWVLGMSALVAGPASSRAHDLGFLYSGTDGAPKDRPHHGRGLFHSRYPPIPRTYSYYYNTWFNQPCHSRVVGPDGRTWWRTTVRGLPLGAPWPSYGGPEQR
jgi:hypothetical protein